MPILLCVVSLYTSGQISQRAHSDWNPYLLGTEQGLSSNFSYAITQDRKGFLWIATHDGLNRYDGYGFRVYRHNASDPHSLPGNTITAVQADRQNRVWVIADGMLAVFDQEKDRVATLSYPGLATGVRQILVTPDQRLLVAGRTSALIDLKTLQPIALGEQMFLPVGQQPCAGNIQYGISAQGQLLAVQTCGKQLRWFSFDPATNRFRLFHRFTIAQGEALITPVTSATMDRHGRLHLVFSNYHPLMLDERDSIIHLSPSAWTANHLLEDREGAMFYSSEAGLYVRPHDLENRQVPATLSVVVPSEVMRHGFQDQTGMLWFAGSKGIFRVDPKQRHILHFGSRPVEGRSIVDEFVFGMLLKPDGRICVEYFGQPQYTLIDPATGLSTHLPIANRSRHEWIEHRFLETGASLPGKQVIADLSRKLQFLQIPPEMIRCIMIDTPSNAWLVVNNTLRHTGSDFSVSLPDNPIDVKTDEGGLWLAFSGRGLWRFDPKSGHLRRQMEGQIKTGDITCILPGDSGLLWVGTKGAGIYRVDPQAGTYRQYSEVQGLAHNTVYCMTRDKRGRLWIGTANGLSCLQPSQGSFQHFFKGHGFANAEYNRHSAITLEDGRVAVGGMNGMDVFHPDSLSHDTRETIVQLIDVKVHNVSRGVHSLYRLNHDEHMVSVHFAVMDFRQPENNQFQYQLGNADTGWIMLGNRNSISFDYLQPGQHTIRIRGANSDGRWSTGDLVLRLDIDPAWYQRWWFYLFVFMVAAGSVYLLFSYRLKQKLRVYQVRQRIHRDLHDDVGATLSSVKAYAEILAEHPDHPVIPALIAENATEMIERLEVISWAADPRHDNFSSLRNRMVKYANAVCHAKGIEFTMTLEGIEDSLEVPGEIRQNLFMVFKEAIHNMIKYADARRCEVQMSVIGKVFIMRIQDDGKGSDGIIRGTGHGWKNMETRAVELDGEVRIQTAPGQGTTISFHLRFPFSLPNSWGRNGH